MIYGHQASREKAGQTGGATSYSWQIGVTAPLDRGHVVDLLLMAYRRRPPDRPPLEIPGGTGLLEFWLVRVGFE